MVVETKYLTVRMEEVAAVGRNDTVSIFITYKSGSIQTLNYPEGDTALGADYSKLRDALKQAPTLELHEK